MPTIGSRIDAGATPTDSKSRKVTSSASARMQTITIAASVMTATISCSQKPARVSTILRSSTPVRRAKEMFMRGTP